MKKVANSSHRTKARHIVSFSYVECDCTTKKFEVTGKKVGCWKRNCAVKIILESYGIAVGSKNIQFMNCFSNRKTIKCYRNWNKTRKIKSKLIKALQKRMLPLTKSKTSHRPYLLLPCLNRFLPCALRNDFAEGSSLRESNWTES